MRKGRDREGKGSEEGEGVREVEGEGETECWERFGK
jgi:hypothetical protein